MRLHLVDGTYELFRAHFSARPSGPRKATIGLASSMLALLHDEDESVTHVGIAFDNPIRSIRNDWFDGYKTDEGVPADLLAQFDAAEEAAIALGMVVWSMDRYEADDAIATAAARFRDEVEQVRMLTPDKDLAQAIRGRRVVQVDRMRKRIIDENDLLRSRGIRPSAVPDWLALVGDTADGIPGIRGFGAKTASALLRVFGRLEEIPGKASAWPADIRGARQLAATLAEQMQLALFYRKLATLIDDVPLAQRLEDLAWTGVPREAFVAWCNDIGAEELKDRPRRWRQSAS
ncbi:MAG TPA: 5'-3' exonuclease H3TH domain-containing protein [Polyangiaceae bacterium]|jgi:5'-3' exonuclease|nr:5'-3' exonuclease H3TH domain-containing protein [Polyangiaceae bacterium]